MLTRNAIEPTHRCRNRDYNHISANLSTFITTQHRLTPASDPITPLLLPPELLNRQKSRIQHPIQININDRQIRLLPALVLRIILNRLPLSNASDRKYVIEASECIDGLLECTDLTVPVYSVELDREGFGAAALLEFLCDFLGPGEVLVSDADFDAAFCEHLCDGLANAAGAAWRVLVLGGHG